MRTLVLSSSSQKEQCGLPAECTCRHPTHNTRRERQRSVTPKAATTPGRFPRRISRNKSLAVANLARVARLVPAAEVIHALVAIGGASDRPTPGSPPARACGVWPPHCRAKNTEKSSHNGLTHIRRNTDEKGTMIPLRRQAALARAPNRVLLAAPLASADIRHQVPVYRKRARTF
eukprot:COSAG01_NODE_9962_length_2291_cov_1.187956_2_plen_175_part_00